MPQMVSKGTMRQGTCESPALVRDGMFFDTVGFGPRGLLEW